MEHYALTGPITGQLNMLFILVTKEIGSPVKPGAKKPPAVGLFDSVAMVVMLMRRNSTRRKRQRISIAAENSTRLSARYDPLSSMPWQR